MILIYVIEWKSETCDLRACLVLIGVLRWEWKEMEFHRDVELHSIPPLLPCESVIIYDELCFIITSSHIL